MLAKLYVYILNIIAFTGHGGARSEVAVSDGCAVRSFKIDSFFSGGISIVKIAEDLPRSARE